MRNVTIFAPSHGTHSSAKILFAYAEKDEGRKSLQTKIFYGNHFVCDGFAITNEMIRPGRLTAARF
jgi:hypothetical protein